MTAKILSGETAAKAIRQSLTSQISERTSKGKRAPGLAVILVGDDPASEVYVRNKAKACKEVGINSVVKKFSESITQSELARCLDELNNDDSIDGIIVQLPLPSHIDPQFIIEHIDHKKDVDGFHPYNLGKLAQQSPALRPCTPYGIMKLLEANSISVEGLNAVVVGASNIVGRPMALELLHASATVTICHNKTKDLETHIKHAELLVVAIGKPGVIQSSWLKPGVIIIDSGITRLADGKLTGDIEFESAKEIASMITPVPGGVGPMTVATLLQNTFECYLRK